MSKLKDIYLDILHIYRSDLVAGFPQFGRRSFYGPTVYEKLKNATRSLSKALRDFLYSFFDSKENDFDKLFQKHWLYVLGTNNYHSLKFLANDNHTVYVTPYNYQLPTEDCIKLKLPYHFLYLVRNIPTFCKLLYHDKPTRRCWDAAFKAMGLYESSIAFLKKHQPRCITFSNDHVLEARAMMLAAKALKVPTFYIQHACVRNDFPPLKFSCSFLEGQDALDKYSKSGKVEGQVKLVGVPRIEPYLPQRRKHTAINKIAVCSNLLDSITAIEEVIDVLKTTFPNLQLTYRPHPNDKREVNVDAAVLMSNSKKVNPFEFLLGQDLVIAGNTSIHYEAAMLNVLSIAYKFDKDGKTEDMYGFVRNGLVKEMETPESLIKYLKKACDNPAVSSQNATYYNAVLNTKNEGKSKEIVLKAIQNLLIQKNTGDGKVEKLYS